MEPLGLTAATYPMLILFGIVGITLCLLFENPWVKMSLGFLGIIFVLAGLSVFLPEAFHCLKVVLDYSATILFSIIVGLVLNLIPTGLFFLGLATR